MDELTRALRGLESICTYCERITHAVHRFGSKDVFLVDYAYQATCAFSLQQIGEIVKTNESWLRSKSPEFYWKGYTRFRDFVAHNYQNIDYDLLWAAVQNDVSPIWDEALSLIERFANEDREIGTETDNKPRDGSLKK